ncbi:MAG: flagellar biosynthetic protein FliO [Candidatus Acidiferrales bacterium]|jgi:flagellar biogenesis protein FliO
MKISPALELPELNGSPQASLLGALWARLQSVWDSLRVQRRARHLHLCESLSLGEKRLLAVVEFEQQRFLVAATPERITLLQTLGAARPPDTPPGECA